MKEIQKQVYRGKVTPDGTTSINLNVEKNGTLCQKDLEIKM